MFIRLEFIMIKEEYRAVDLEVITFDAADVIVTSDGDEGPVVQ